MQTASIGLETDFRLRSRRTYQVLAAGGLVKHSRRVYSPQTTLRKDSVNAHEFGVALKSNRNLQSS